MFLNDLLFILSFIVLYKYKIFNIIIYLKKLKLKFNMDEEILAS